MKSSMFMLWIVTAVLSYAHKIPYIRRIIGFLSIVYGRTTIWKVLVKLRKAFIMFNALIGVYMVFNTVGFSYDNILAGFAGMGHSYLEIFTNFTKRLFNWTVELFDHKVVPNVPGDSSSGGSITRKLFNTGPIDKSVYNPFSNTPPLENSLRKQYNSLLNLNVDPTPTSWYNYNNLWWLGGLIIKGVAIAGFVYFGYKFIVDPLIVEHLKIDKGKGVEGVVPVVASTPGPSTTVTPATPEGSISSSEGSTAFHVFGSTLKSVGKSLKKLNPSYWFISDNGEEYEAFMDYQKSGNYNRNLYPHSKFNPYDSLIKRMRIYYFGETVLEKLDRKTLKYDILHSFGPIKMGSSTSALTVSTSNTPQLSPIGLNLTLAPGLTFNNEFAETASKIASLPSTPGMRSMSHLITEGYTDPYADNTVNIAEAVNRINSPELDEVTYATGLAFISYNKYRLLEEENI